jgi:hypothetical protein
MSSNLVLPGAKLQKMTTSAYQDALHRQGTIRNLMCAKAAVTDAAETVSPAGTIWNAIK